jgi:glycosyltransferase involved in cell wall biosynthesis
MQGLRVAFFTPWRIRCGITDYSRHLVDGLRGLPDIADVRIVEPPENATRTGTLAALRGYAEDERRFRALGAAMNAPEADIAHVQHQYFLFGGVAPHKNHARSFLDAVNRPLVMTVHEIAQPGPASGASFILHPSSFIHSVAIAHTNCTNFLHPHIRAYIVHTEDDRAALVALGVAPERVHRVVHGVPVASPLPDPEEAKRTLGLAGRRVLMLFGFLSIKKGHGLALEALKRLPPDVFLLLAGDQHPDDYTDYVPSLRRAIAADRLEDRVRITGYLPMEQIPVVMAATDLALAPYLQSSGSGSLANLLAYGRAIVASDIAPHREIAAEPPAALALCRAGDAAALADAVQAIFTDEARREALRASALNYAARHSYVEMARETAKIYRMVLTN